MNANQLADMLECLGWRSVDANLREAADMLRRQHEAIVKLREELGEIAKTPWVDAALDPQRLRLIAQQALKDTEEFK